MKKRELKFRAWDEKQQHMAYQGTPDLETIQSFFFHFGDEELMQFTGLLDSSGKVEVYEDDIIHIPGKPELNRQVYYSPEVAAFGVRFLDHESRQWDHPYQRLTQDWINFVGAIVIGNIYQNPELLIDSPESEDK